MALRREIISYLGTGAIGGIIGYYTGAQHLLGIQSEEVVTVSDSEEPTAESMEEPPENTLTETQTPTQPSGKNVFDDFEDQELGWEIISGNSSTFTYSPDSINQSQSLYFERSSSNENGIIAKSLPSGVTPTSISYWFKYESQNDNQFNLKFLSSDENQIIEIREFFQAVHYKNSFEQGVTAEQVADITVNSWYRVTLQNINYENSELDIIVSDGNGNEINRATNISFREDAVDFRRIRIANGLSNNGGSDPLWIDYITYQS